MRVALAAGEASGDLLAGLLLDGLKHQWPDIESYGIGGAHMVKRGFTAWWPSDKLAVRGYLEVLLHYREIISIRRQLKARLLNSPPDLFIGIDAPDFNLDLARDLKEAGIKTMQFVSPSIWAWRGERIHAIKASVDHVLCIFPFEPAIYAEHGVSASYVGHPLAKVIPMTINQAKARALLALSHSDQVVAVMPGSRASEVQYLGETFAKTVVNLLVTRPHLKIIIPAVPQLKSRITDHLNKALEGRLLQFRGQVRILDGQSHLALEACDVCLVASGTATLEAALFKKPMVIAYKMNWLSWLLTQRKRYQPWVGLPNILCRQFLVPEFLQDAATAQSLSQATLAWLDNPSLAKELARQFTELHQTLLRDTQTLSVEAVSCLLGQVVTSHEKKNT